MVISPDSRRRRGSANAPRRASGADARRPHGKPGVEERDCGFPRSKTRGRQGPATPIVPDPGGGAGAVRWRAVRLHVADSLTRGAGRAELIVGSEHRRAPAQERPRARGARRSTNEAPDKHRLTTFRDMGDARATEKAAMAGRPATCHQAIRKPTTTASIVASWEAARPATRKPDGDRLHTRLQNGQGSWGNKGELVTWLGLIEADTPRDTNPRRPRRPSA